MTNIIKKIVLTLFVAVFTLTLTAQNPLFSGYADPHIKIWNGKMYMAVGKDRAITNTKCLIDSWSIFSSIDLINWTEESVIDPKDTYLGADYEYCWASDIASKNGNFFLYFSNHDKATGVLKSDNANGPYLDVLGQALLTSNLYDPTVFEDEDGRSYIIAGLDGRARPNKHYKIARLNDDMISLAETPKDILTDQVNGFGTPNPTDANYLHKYNGVYYLSTRDKYMTSTNIYGPYTNLRKSGQGGHKSYCEYNGQWYTAFNGFVNNNAYYRNVNITYAHFKDNGDLVDDAVFANKGARYSNGVGSYDSNWDKIEAEWFFKRTGSLVKKESPSGGFEIQNICNNDCLNFPNIKNMPANSSINFRISSANSNGGQIEIRKDSEDGMLLGVCDVPNTANWTTYQTLTCQLNNTSGANNIYFVFKGSSNDFVHLDWFNITNHTAVRDIKSENKLKKNVTIIYPELGSDLVFIKLCSPSKTGLKIFNSLGMVVYHNTKKVKSYSLSAKNIGSSGMYLVRADDSTEKLIIR